MSQADADTKPTADTNPAAASPTPTAAPSGAVPTPQAAQSAAAPGGEAQQPSTAPTKGAPDGTTKPADGSLLGDGKEPADAAQKTGDPEKPAEPVGAPEKYETFKFPDGFTADEKQLEAFTPVAKALNLSQDAAQKLIDYEVARVKAATDEHNQWRAELRQAAQAIPQFSEVATYARRAGLEMIKSLPADRASELREMLFGNETILGIHPAFIQGLAAIGKRLSEDRPAEMGTPTHAKELTWAEKHYSKVE